MKKVSLLLAVLLVLTCCLLAACGGDEDTSSTETSSANVSADASSTEETSSESPSASEESSVAESSVEETPSEPEESSVSDETSEEEPPAGYDGDVTENTDGANLALNKTYTGADASTHDGVKQYNAKLTDGAALESISYSEGDWFAYYYNPDAAGDQVNAPNKVGSFVLDLEQVYAISSVKINTYLGNTGDGILPPKSIKVEYSADGSSYSTLAEQSFPTADPENKTEAIVEFLEFKGDAKVPAQYIRVTIELQGIFAFINEVEVY